MKNIVRYCDRHFLLNYFGCFILLLLLKPFLRKFDPWFMFGSFFHLSLLSISVNLQYAHAWILYHFCAGFANCYLDILDQLQRLLSRTVGPTLAASLKFLTHRRDVSNFRFFCTFFLGDVHVNWMNYFRLFILVGGRIVILIVYMIFLLPFPDTKVHVKRLYPYRSRLKNYLSAEYFPLA